MSNLDKLKSYYALVDALAEMFGPNCEVVLHDLSKPKHSIVKIANGHVTNRKVGGPIRDLVPTVLRSNKLKDDHLVNYLTKTEDGKILKSTTILIRDQDSEVIGTLCINYDIGYFIMAKKMIEDFCNVTDLNSERSNDMDESEMSRDVKQILESIINKTIIQSGKTVSIMNKEDKLEIVKFLDEKGVFLIKGAVEYLAQEFNMSRYTVYNYIEETRSTESLKKNNLNRL